MSDHGNRQKHLTPNPIQKILMNRFHAKIAELVRQANAPVLLDAGCAEGFVIQHLRTDGVTIKPYGVDYDTDALLWGRSELQHGVPLSNVDLHHLPFPDNSFSLVMCLEVLEHLPSSEAGLRQLARVSSEYILISVPHEPFFRGANFLRGKHVSDFGNDPEHLHNYSGRGFRRMATRVIDIVWHGYSFPWQIILGKKRN
ncbi:MAG: methyltransferase domain-containing protein [Chloroflexota bacterium]